MRNKTIWVSAAAVLLASVAGVVMMRNHGGAKASDRVEANVLETGPVIGDAEAMRAITAAGVPIDDLSVRSAGGIYILRGSGDPAAAERAIGVLKGLGVTRVANLITATKKWDDEKIRRDAERELASRPALAGTRLSVTCDEGVITVSGTVQHELQKDLARATLASVRGVREIKIDLARL
jgi:osmotically-inducible protein OsmY